MASTAQGRTPVHLWIVGILSLIWSAFGCYDYVMSVSHNQKYLSMYGSSAADMIAWLNSMPVWAVAAWAVGVWGALAGSLLLLVRSRHALTAFVLSLLGLLVSTVYQFAMSSEPLGARTGTMIVMEVVIWAIALFLVGYSRAMANRGVLR
jgi:hypothetical protein